MQHNIRFNLYQSSTVQTDPGRDHLDPNGLSHIGQCWSYFQCFYWATKAGVVVITTAPKRTARKNSSARTLSHLWHVTSWMRARYIQLFCCWGVAMVTITFWGNGWARWPVHGALWKWTVRFLFFFKWPKIQIFKGKYRKTRKHRVCLELLRQQEGKRGFLVPSGWWWNGDRGAPVGEVRPAPHMHAVTYAHAAKSKKPGCKALEWMNPRWGAKEDNIVNTKTIGRRSYGEGKRGGERKIINQLLGCGRPFINIHT